MIVSGLPRDNALTLGRALAIGQRRRNCLIFPTVAGLAISLVSYADTPYSFISEAVVALDARRVALPTETVVSPLPQDSPVLRTELDIITSRSMATKVVAQLERDGVSVRKEERPRFSLSGLKSLLRGSAEASEPLGETSEENRSKINRLLSGLRVSNDGRSFTIFLTFSSSDPVYAAKVANAFALTYLDHQTEVQRSATRRVSDWLGETLVTIRADLEASEQAAENFRQKAGLAETNGVTVQAQRVAALNTELAATRAAFSGMEARLHTLEGLSSGEQFPSVAEILGSPIVQTLRIEQANVERRLRELQDSKAVKSAENATLQSELESIKRQIGEEIARIVASLTNEISIAHQKEESLKIALQSAQEELSQANHAELALAQLEREAAANRTIYESYLVRYKQTIEQDGIASPEAQVISFAVPADTPANPRLAAWIMFGLGLGGSIGVAAALFREATDRGPRMLETLKSTTGVSVIGALPQLRRREQGNLDRTMRDTDTVIGRALSVLRRALNLKCVKKPSPVIIVTSARPGDGKTTLVLGIARSAAAAGIRTVVVDANLRSPAVEAGSGAMASAYINELMTSDMGVRDLVHDVGDELSIIAARQGGSPELLLASPRFRALIQELKLRFDLVLIDAPESAAMENAGFAGKLLFVVAFKTRRLDQVIASIRDLTARGHRPDGIILNGVDHQNYEDLSNQLLAAGCNAAEAFRVTEASPIRKTV